MRLHQQPSPPRKFPPVLFRTIGRKADKSYERKQTNVSTAHISLTHVT